MTQTNNYNLKQIKIVLVHPEQSGNIGAVARIMKNMGLSNLHLVKPNDFPSAQATARASHADDILFNATICNDLKQAISDCNLVIASSVRQREIKWQQLYIKQTCDLIKKSLQKNDEKNNIAIVFGRESTGLNNEELCMCNLVMVIPTHKNYLSLNLSMAVAIFCYELSQTLENIPTTKKIIKERNVLANSKQVESFFVRLEQVIDIIKIPEHKPRIYLMRRLRKIFLKAKLESNEVSLLQGILSHIIKNNKK